MERPNARHQRRAKRVRCMPFLGRQPPEATATLVPKLLFGNVCLAKLRFAAVFRSETEFRRPAVPKQEFGNEAKVQRLVRPVPYLVRA